MDICIYVIDTKEVIAIVGTNKKLKDIILSKEFDVIKSPGNLIIEDGRIYLPSKQIKRNE